MKRKILILMALVVAIVCMLAISVSAAEPNNEGKTVTLADGTVCALYDTDGNPLIWYITSTDADTGAKTYAYIAANDSAVDYYNGWNGGDQLNSIKITVADTTYEKGTFVVLNLYGAKITSGQRIGNEITYFSKTFTSATNLEYAFLPLGTTGLGSEDFKSCSNLQFVNIEELTELTRIGSQSFNGCPKLFAGKKVDLSNTKLVSTDTNALAT
ncbi:MAG: leucine-rich repeat protein, partial [Clostridia bacterium]|nr:leucine-rich repeat protein [Clostridia bacterium]